jgi:hypothetical protein
MMNLPDQDFHQVRRGKMDRQAMGREATNSGSQHPVRNLRRYHVTFTGLALVALLVAVLGGTQALARTAAPETARAAPANTAVLTYKYDTYRTGQNPNETILNTSNVNPTQFGKRVSYPVDGYVYAQPLFVPNLTIGGSVHNVVFVATEHDSVYAFDADQTTPIAPFWHTSFIDPPTVTTIPAKDTLCTQIVPEIGITGTPVIDLSTNTLYVVVATKENGQYFQRLHALNITTGQEEPGSPVTITASVKGNGAGSKNGMITFTPLLELNRPGLLLANGLVYTAWGSHCDLGPSHGWVIAYNATTLQQDGVANTTPNGKLGSIWQSGGGVAADSSGNIYLTTSNGTFDLGSGNGDAGDTIVKASPQSTLADYFTPFNQACLQTTDNDLGSAGPLLIPSDNDLIQIGKEGRIYVVDRTNMGKYTSIPNPCNNQNLTNVDKVLQEFPPGTVGGMYSTPAYWDGSTGEFVYMGGANDALKAYQLTNELLSSSPTSQSSETFNYPGTNPVVSSNGTTAGTGIVWVIDPAAVLRAYDATNLANEIYNSNADPGRDRLPSYVKFSAPTVANGEVFVGTHSTLEIYGLLG